MLLSKEELETVFALRKALSTMPMADVTEQLIDQMIATKNNEEFLKRTSYFLKIIEILGGNERILWNWRRSTAKAC